MELMMMEADEGEIEPGGNESRPPSEKLKCEHCDYTSNCPVEIKIHLDRLHSGLKRGEAQCPLCAATFRNPGSMRFHLRKSHTKTAAQRTETRLTGTHVPGNPPMRIERSPKPNGTSEGPPFKCDYCQKTFQFQSKRKWHEWSHTRPFTCHLCDSSFSSPFNLRNHLNRRSHGTTEGIRPGIDQHSPVPPASTPIPFSLPIGQHLNDTFPYAIFTTMADLDENQPLGGQCGRGDEEEDLNDPSSGDEEAGSVGSPSEQPVER